MLSCNLVGSGILGSRSHAIIVTLPVDYALCYSTVNITHTKAAACRRVAMVFDSLHECSLEHVQT